MVSDSLACKKMDISLLLDPQSKHQRMYRGDSMYEEQSVVDFEMTECNHCNRTFAPKAYAKHCSGIKPKCLTIKKRSVYDSARKRIVNNEHFSIHDKRQALQSSRENKKDDHKRKWTDESSELRAAVKLLRVAKKAKIEDLYSRLKSRRMF